MSSDFAEVWVYLSGEPLWWLTATLVAYGLGDACFRLTGRRAWVNPVLIAVTLLALALLVTGTDYATYFNGAQFIHFMLGPVTVCLAIPLYENRRLLRRAALPMLAALLVGVLVAAGSAWLLGRWAGLPTEALLSLAPKSATAPVAMGISERIGGSPTLTAVLVILTGITGALLSGPLLVLTRRWRGGGEQALGFALGVASHGIGTARAFQLGETAGAFAGVAMGLSALVTGLLVPLLVGLLS